MSRSNRTWTWFAAVFLTGCIRPAPEPALSPAEIAIVSAAIECDKHIADEIAAHDDCPAAQLAINAHRECRVAFPAGLTLDCPEFRR